MTLPTHFIGGRVIWKVRGVYDTLANQANQLVTMHNKALVERKKLLDHIIMLIIISLK